MLRSFLKSLWITTRQAAITFAACILLILALTPVFLGKVNANTMPFWTRFPWGILGVVGPVAIFFLWIGMWSYWVYFDTSGAWAKRISFLILLLGFWWGACIYYLFVYLPQTVRRSRLTT